MNNSIHNEEFEELKFEEQCKIVYQTPITRKGDLIVRSEQPEALLNTFSAEEAYLMVREMDSTNVPELVQYANFAQLQFMSDFECWQGDAISDRGFIQWLEYLEEASDEKLRLWLTCTDFKLLIAGFQKCMTVLKPYHEEAVDEVIGDNPYFTLDGLYYIMISEDNLQIVKRAVAMLFDQEKHLYYNLLEGIISETGILIEEEAYSSHQLRMSEKGFPEREAAMQIYRPLSEDEWEKHAKRKRGIRVDTQEALPMYPVQWTEEKLFFDDVLATLSGVERNEALNVYQELVWLCNKIIVAEGAMHFNEKRVRSALNHARYVLNIALEDLSGGDIAKGHALLMQHWVEYLFRWGFSRITRMRPQAERMVKSSWEYDRQRLYHFLEKPFGESLRGLFQMIPRFYDTGEDSNIEKSREFKTLRDVVISERRIACIQNLFYMLNADAFDGWQSFLNEFSTTAILDHEDVSIVSIVFTVMARCVLDKSFQLKPLVKQDIGKLMQKLFLGKKQEGELREIAPEVRARCIKKISAQCFANDSKRIEELHPFFEIIFKSVAEELGSIMEDDTCEERFITCLLIRKGKNH